MVVLLCTLPEKGWKETKRRGIWRTEEIHDAGNGRGILFIWGGTISVRGAGPECRMLHEGCSIQNATQWHHVIYGKKKRATTQTPLNCFFKRVDRTESSKEAEPMLSSALMSEPAAYPQPPTAEGPSALPSPTPSPPPPVSDPTCIFTQRSPYVPAVTLYFSKSCTVRFKMLYFLFVFYVFS